MSAKDPDLKSLVREWQSILDDTSLPKKMRVAAIAHAIVSESYDARRLRHPAYDYATTIAAQLELPDTMIGNSDELWDMLCATVAVLDRNLL